MSSAFGAELREFIRRLGVDGDRILSAERRAAALREGIRDFSSGFKGGGSGDCLTTINATVWGCNFGRSGAVPLPGAIVRIFGHTTGNDYGEFTLAAGTLSAGLVIDAADTQLDFYVRGPGVRFADATADVRTVTRCATNTLTFSSLVPATGYHCDVEFPWPIADTLDVIDSEHGTTTASWTSTTVFPGVFAPNWLSPTRTVAAPAGPCAASNTDLTYIFGTMAGSGQFMIVHQHWLVGNLVTMCPTAAGPSSVSQPHFSSWRSGTVPTATVKMDLTSTITAGSLISNTLYGGNSATVRVREP